MIAIGNNAAFLILQNFMKQPANGLPLSRLF
jgi:hypothetical protein